MGRVNIRVLNLGTSAEAVRRGDRGPDQQKVTNALGRGLAGDP